MSEGSEMDPNAHLRSRAEARLNERGAQAPGLDSEQLVHELQVHQAELEMQNDELRRTQEKLENSRRELSDLYEYAPVGYVTLDANGRIRLANFTFCEMAGAAKGQLLGRSFGLLIVAQDRPRFYAQYALFSKRNAMEPVDVRIASANNKAGWVRVSGTADLDRGTYRIVVTDINAIKEADEELKRLNDELHARIEERDVATEHLRRFRTALDNSGDSVFIVDRHTMRFVDVNARACERLQYTRNELLAMEPVDISHGLTREKLSALFDQLEQSPQERHSAEGIHQRKDGTRYPVEVTLGLVQSDNNQPLVVATARDVTERKRYEMELRQAKDEAEAANQAKSLFLASMSHEIRTPLNGVLGIAELLAATSLEDSQQEYLQVIRQSALSLLDIINDILDLSKIEAGRLELDRIVFDLHETLNQMCRSLIAVAQANGLTLQVNIAPGTPRYVCGDPLRLRQILFNLVGNALKFTEEGGCTVTLSPGGTSDSPLPAPDADAVRLLFEVADTGCGIPEHLKSRIFESFAQGDTSCTREHGGTGLGLAICRHLTDLMGGRIWFESPEGGGAIFRVELDLLTADPKSKAESVQAGQPSTRPELPAMRFLLVEDNPTNQLVIRDFLEQHGHSTTCAANGREALEALLSSRFDVILMDIEMPVMGGEQATAAIRAGETGPRNKSIPIVALTAHALKGARERFRAAGMDAYVSKPVDFGNLIREIQLALECARLREAEAAGGEAVLDIQRALDALLGNRSLLLDLFTIFKRDCGGYMERLQTALRGGDSDIDSTAATHAAHSLRGAAATVGAMAVSAHAAQVENLLNQGLHDGAAEELDTLEHALSKACRAIDAELDAS